MNTEIPHTLQWGFVPYGDGKELLGSIVVRMSVVDSVNSMTEREMLLQLSRSMAQVIGCPMARIAFHPVPDWADKTEG